MDILARRFINLVKIIWISELREVWREWPTTTSDNHFTGDMERIDVDHRVQVIQTRALRMLLLHLTLSLQVKPFLTFASLS